MTQSNGPQRVVVQGAVPVTDNAGSVTVDGTVAVSNFPATQAVSGTVTANAGTGTQAVSLATNTPDVTDRAARLLGHVTVDTAPTTAVTPPTLTKGTQGATGFSVQNLKDAGRSQICFTTSRTASAAVTETLLTHTLSRDGAATTTGTTYIITSGKRLRITSISATFEAAGTTPVICRHYLRVRVNTAGAVTTASPLQFVMGGNTPATAKSITSVWEDTPDGFEWAGNGTVQIGFTWEAMDWVTTTNVPVLSLSVFGFEY